MNGKYNGKKWYLVQEFNNLALHIHIPYCAIFYFFIVIFFNYIK